MNKRVIAALMIGVTGIFINAKADLLEAKASKTRMEHQHTVMLVDRCFKIHGEIKPSGCDFDEEKAITVRGVAADTTRLHQLDFPKGVFSPLHNHPDEEIFYITKGKFRVMSDGEEFLLGVGDMIIVPAFVPHQFEALEESSLLEVGGPGPMLGLMRADEPNTK
ncbi:MAG: cupin domain-containing protein [Pseudomonadota bacterium]